jgi:hypothetical protein
MRFTIIRNTERADEERQRKTLEDKRDKDDAERKKDDFVAPGEGCSGGGGKRKRKGGCERHDTPHARPRDDRDMLPSGIGIAASFANEKWQIGRREDPENSGSTTVPSLPPHRQESNQNRRATRRQPPAAARSK